MMKQPDYNSAVPTSGESAAATSSLARQLTLAVLVPVVLLIAMGGVLAWQLGRMKDTQDWVLHTDIVMNRWLDLRSRLAEQESALRAYLLSGDRRQLADFDAEPTAPVIDELTALTIDNPAQTARLREVRGSIDAWREHASREMTRDYQVARDDKDDLTLRARFLSDARALIRAGVANEQELLRARNFESDDAQRTARIVFITLIVLAGLGLAFVSRRQLTAVSRAFQALVGDERRARDAATAEEWVRTGQAEVARSMLGGKSVDGVARAALDSLAAHSDAVVGAFYIATGDGLDRLAGHALAADAPAHLSLDDGQLGQAVRSGGLRTLRGLELGHLKIASGISSREPAEVAIVPAFVDDQLVAVLELGYRGSVAARERELLSTVTTTIAVAIRTAQQRARLQDVLEETQRQGEELQTQHEELRVTNEELEHQGEALRAAQGRQERIQHELEAANANLEEQTANLEAKNEELIRAQRDLERHARELTLASQYKSEFLAKMSHELRTPLNSTLILARLLGDNPAGNLTDEQVKFANTIYAAGNDLLLLINDILDLAKIEAGRLELRVASVPIARLRETLLRGFEPVAATRGLRFAVDIEPKTPNAIDTDEQRVIQVLRNLASNACKFTERGEVTVTIRTANGSLLFDVRDTGIGIPADHQQRVFDAFHQVDGSVSRRHGGTGLGLAISRELATLLGGTLELTSAPGAGSTFTLAIPLVAPVVSARERPPSGPVAVSQSGRPRAQTKNDAAPLMRQTGQHPVAGTDANANAVPYVDDDRAGLDPSKRKLLIIDDDMAFATIMRDLGRELGFQTLVAGTADAGVALAQRYAPDGILCDVKLPDHSGLSVLERLKRQSITRHIPVHMVSVDDYAHRALELGAVGYIMKPASRDELTAAIRRVEDRTASHVRRLLVVEDDPIQVDLLTKLLGGVDIELESVGSIKDALARLAAVTYDCVVIDLVLADGTGFDLLEQMASHVRATFPPVIVHTAKDLTADEEARLRKYSSSIIVKGARSPDRLIDEVSLFLHQVEADLPPERQRMLRQVRDREALFEGKTVLVAEDDVRNVFALSSILEPRGLKVVIARNGKEALDLLDRVKVDLVLMDVMMPEMDGLEATRQIRTRADRAKQLPIIALTAKAMADDREACLAAGANDYLSKPIDVDMLLSLLRVWMPR